jgi:hypothetical protein
VNPYLNKLTPKRVNNNSHSVVNHHSVVMPPTNEDLIVSRVPIIKPNKHIPMGNGLEGESKQLKNLKNMRSDIGINNTTGDESYNEVVPRRIRKRGPLLAPKAVGLFPSLERSTNNQSDLSLKLPDIKKPLYRLDNESSSIAYSYTKDSSIARGLELSVNYTEDKRERLR